MDELIAMFEVKGEASISTPDYDIYVRSIKDESIPHRYIMFVRNVFTDKQGFEYYSSIFKSDQVFMNLCEKI